MQASTTYDCIYFGNPIMDISVNDDAERTICKKYCLEMNSACLATPEQMSIYREAFAMEGRLVSPGGSALNSARAHKSANADSKVAFFGCIGKDDFGGQMKAAVAEAGVDAKWAETDEEPTGTCCCVVCDKERTLCANIAAAKKFPLGHLEAAIAAGELRSQVFYTTGFFLDSNFDAVMKLCEHSKTTGIPLAFNISAPFIIFVYKTQIEEVFKYADFVFCNEDEGSTYAEAIGLAKEDRVGCAKAIACMPKLTERPRTVIITQGAEPTIVVTASFQADGSAAEPDVQMVNVAPIDKASIVDTNGAGDGFVGAFINALASGKPLVGSIDAGNAMGGFVVQKSGAVYK